MEISDKYGVRVVSLIVLISLFVGMVLVSDTAMAADPGDTSYIHITSGTGSFSAISTSNKQISVAPGSSITGSITMSTTNSWASSASTRLIGTSNWGTHSSSYWTVGSVATGSNSYTSSGVSLTAPSSAGTYYLIFAFRAETSGGAVASATNWATGSPIWNDGNDIADFTSTQVSQAQSYGQAAVDWCMTTGYTLVNVPSDAIVINVQSSSGSITVTSPTSSSVWTAGQTYYITWTSSGTVGSYVKIEYDYSYYSTLDAVVITSSTSNDGSYSWTIPSITPRTDYLIRVTSTSYSSIYDDSPLFEITATVGYNELRVTLHSDGTEHDYVKTTDSSVWTSIGTFWASGDAYNKQQSTSGAYTILEFDLNSVQLYERGAQTSLHSEGTGTDRIWIYSDSFGLTVDTYVLILPSDSVSLSSNPSPASRSGLELTWRNISGETTHFKSQQYNGLIGDTSTGNSALNNLFWPIVLLMIAVTSLMIVIAVMKRRKKDNESGGMQPPQSQPMPQQPNGSLSGSSQNLSSPNNCPRCGQLIGENWSTCPKCGASLK